MRTLPTLVATCFATCMTAVPALASIHFDPPNGAPAPLLAAGIPAFIAIGGGALVMKIIGRHQRSAE
jgi:hypothetical protein